MIMKKEQIIERIETFEEKITELKELVQRFYVNTWEDLNKIDGYYIKTNSEISVLVEESCFEYNRKIFKTRRHALSALAMAQISQLMPYYGGEITDDEWCDDYINKYVLKRNGIKIIKSLFNYTYQFLAFHTEEQRDEFLANNEQLVKDYLMIE